MKHIGHIDGAGAPLSWRTHSLGMLSPHELFIPSPGERENVSADQWQHVGWVTPDTDGGTVWADRTSTDKDTRPAYIRRIEQIGSRNDEVAAAVQPESGYIYTDGPYTTTPGPEVVWTTKSKTDPMDVRRSEFDALVDRVNKLEARPPASAESPMTFYDHAFIAAYAALMQSATSYPMTEAIARAHSVAIELTRNRAERA